ncbi:MAG: SixA phosphatase family protein [Planctomycetota bacterium]|jgi:broad specificity phosphatase PhoE
MQHTNQTLRVPGAPLAILVWVLVFLGHGLQESEDSRVDPITVVCVRHAEKASDGGSDPDLTDAGRERAERLGRMLSAAKVTHLFSSPYARTRQTLRPLAEMTELEPVEYDPADTVGLRERLLELTPGSTAVVSGHSNTVPALVAALGGEVDDTRPSQWGEILDHDAHDRAFLLVLDPERGLLDQVELRYGD